MVQCYGNRGTDQTSITVPYALHLAWDTSVNTLQMTCHTKVAASVQSVPAKALAHYGADGIRNLRLNLWGGTLNLRRKRGGTGWSMHAWGVALDYVSDNNKLGRGRARHLGAGRQKRPPDGGPRRGHRVCDHPRDGSQLWARQYRCGAPVLHGRVYDRDRRSPRLGTPKVAESHGVRGRLGALRADPRRDATIAPQRDVRGPPHPAGRNRTPAATAHYAADPGAGVAGEAGHDPAHLIVRSTDEGAVMRFDFTLIPSSGKAAAAQENSRLAAARFREICALVASGKPSNRVKSKEIELAGVAVAGEILHPTVRDALWRDAGAPLIVVHYAEAPRIPWECLPGAKGAQPVARASGISRQYAAANLSVAKWLESRRRDASLRVLLVVDPTSDLPGARAEGNAIETKLAKTPGVAVETLLQGDATKARLLGLLASGRFDVVHYCGHAFFDPPHRARSGLICAPPSRTSPAILSGADLVNLGELPLLLFLNACESARVRGSITVDGMRPGPDAIGAACGIAEAFLRSGVSSFVGTYWPVGDAAASEFAATFTPASSRAKRSGLPLPLAAPR